MSADTVSTVMENLSESKLLTGVATVVWHAGEPLSLSASYYDEAFTRVEKFCNSDLHIDNYVQTNATLVSSQHCEVLARHKVKVGVSLDGPEFLHDQKRRSRSGVGTHARALKGTRLLQEAGISPSAIAVLSIEALRYPDQFYDFFAELGISRVGLNVEEVEGPNTTSSLLASSEYDVLYKDFLGRLMFRSIEDGRVKFREFERLLELVERDEWLGGNSQVNPASMVNVDYLGNFTFFSPEMIGVKSEYYSDFYLGNVYIDSIGAASKTETFRRLDSDIRAGVEACRRECHYFPVCGGGAPSNKFFENGTFSSTETRYCYFSKKLLTDAVIEHAERISKIPSIGSKLGAGSVLMPNGRPSS